jgi:hypothetical protein
MSKKSKDSKDSKDSDGSGLGSSRSGLSSFQSTAGSGSGTGIFGSSSGGEYRTTTDSSSGSGGAASGSGMGPSMMINTPSLLNEDLIHQQNPFLIPSYLTHGGAFGTGPGPGFGSGKTTITPSIQEQLLKNPSRPASFAQTFHRFETEPHLPIPVQTPSQMYSPSFSVQDQKRYE